MPLRYAVVVLLLAALAASAPSPAAAQAAEALVRDLGPGSPVEKTIAESGGSGLPADLEDNRRNPQLRAVLELFTSQGCSACPAADELVGELARDPAIVALTEPVDYWDYLGWKDTLAQRRNTARQRAYAYERGDRELSTPQVVVNGEADVLGSDAAAIANAVAAARGDIPTFPAPVAVATGSERIEVVVGSETKPGSAGEVWLCALTTAVPVAIGAGENRGRTVVYHNVVRRWVKLGDWDGRPQSWTIPRRDIQGEGVDAVAVLVQIGPAERPNRILGAATASLR